MDNTPTVEQLVTQYANERIENAKLDEWKFVINTRLSSRGGVCKIAKREIHVGAWVLEGPWAEIKDIINHELAHALEWKHYGTSGHGESWRMMCELTGARPSPYYGEQLHELRAAIKGRK